MGATCQSVEGKQEGSGRCLHSGFFQQHFWNEQQSKPKSNMHWRCCRRWQGRSQRGPRPVMVLVPPAGASARSGLNRPVLDTRFFPPPTQRNAVATALEPTSPTVPSILPTDQPAMVEQDWDASSQSQHIVEGRDKADEGWHHPVAKERGHVRARSPRNAHDFGDPTENTN